MRTRVGFWAKSRIVGFCPLGVGTLLSLAFSRMKIPSNGNWEPSIFQEGSPLIVKREVNLDHFRLEYDELMFMMMEKRASMKPTHQSWWPRTHLRERYTHSCQCPFCFYWLKWWLCLFQDREILVHRRSHGRTLFLFWSERQTYMIQVALKEGSNTLKIVTIHFFRFSKMFPMTVPIYSYLPRTVIKTLKETRKWMVI